MSAVWRQYLRLKAQATDCLLLFRYGDFYETFTDDAETAASVLDIALTAREMGRGNRVPMAGIPYHALGAYLPKLLAAGHRVAVAEQVAGEPPDTAPDDEHGVVERRLDRILTAGTVIDPSLLDDKANNYLAACLVLGDRAGLAHADLSTGEFAVCELAGSSMPALLRAELARLQPAELVVPRTDARSRFGPPSDIPGGVRITPVDAWKFEPRGARETLLRLYEVVSLEAFGCEGLHLATQAAGALVQYAGETLREGKVTLGALRTYAGDDYMHLDAATLRNLEVFQAGRSGDARGSLHGVLDETKTPMGGRMLRAWLGQPLLDAGAIEARLDRVSELVDSPLLRSRIISHLTRMGDLERLANRVAQSTATPRDLIALRGALVAVSELKELGSAPRLVAETDMAEVFGAHPDDGPHDGVTHPDSGRKQASVPSKASVDSPDSTCSIISTLRSLDACPEVVDLIGLAISPDPPNAIGDGVIAQGFSAELDDLRESTRHAREWIAGAEAREREATGIRGLKVGFNKVFGYYIEITNSNNHLAPARYIRKQTLVNAERYITPELKEYESLVLNARDRINEVERAVFRRLCADLAESKSRVLRTARAVAEVDVYCSLAEVGARHSYVRPRMNTSKSLRIRGGRHPVVEYTRGDEPFVPNDIDLSAEECQIVLLTGPNMAGKSTYLRQAALLVLMAQIGSFVPADEAEIGIVDRIFTRIGAQDDLGAGQSTFLLEMLETAGLLTQATPRSLLILDEVGRGTSTYDGLAIAQAVVEQIHNHPRLQARTLFATHYHELTDLARMLPRVRNYRVDVKEEGDSVAFLHRVVEGAADRSYGIHVAKLAGIPRGVTRRAEEILRELERGKGKSRRQRQTDEQSVWQMALMLDPDPIVEELRTLDVLSLTPIEALTKLYELKQKAVGDGDKGSGGN